MCFLSRKIWSRNIHYILDMTNHLYTLIHPWENVPWLLCGGRWDHGLANPTLPYISRYSCLWVKHPALAISRCSFPPASPSSHLSTVLPEKAESVRLLCKWHSLLCDLRLSSGGGLQPPSLWDPVCSSVLVYMGMCVPQSNCPVSMASPNLTPPIPGTCCRARGSWHPCGRGGWHGGGDWWQHISTSPLPEMPVMSCCSIKS